MRLGQGPPLPVRLRTSIPDFRCTKRTPASRAGTATVARSLDTGLDARYVPGLAGACSQGATPTSPTSLP